MNLLDTSYLIDFEHGHDAAREYFETHEHEPLAVSPISVFELAFGIVWSDTGSLDELAHSLEWVAFLDFSVEDALEGARIQAELQSNGNRLPMTDVMIAGVARNRGATLITSDDHFSLVAGIAVESHRS